MTDAPCANFSDQLLAAYPDAKVILTTRDPDKWIESVERSYYHVLGWWAWKVLAAVDSVRSSGPTPLPRSMPQLPSPFSPPLYPGEPSNSPPPRFVSTQNIGAYTGVLRMILTDWASGNYRDRRALRRGFLAHNAHIRAVVPPNNLLDFTPQQGWEPLCAFLGKEVPEVPFPRVNEGDATADIHRAVMGRKVRAWRKQWGGMVVGVVLAGVVAGVGWWVSGSVSK